jgi:hypothetical protein
MDKSKLDSVKQYLQEEFPDLEITDKYDFDSGAQTFKISADAGLLLLKIGENFVDDNDEYQIVGMLSRWDVADLLRQNPQVGVLVKHEGPESFERE